MRALVTLQLPDDTIAQVPAGGMIGRLANAILRLDDPRISEAHAIVTLRGRRLVLMALRGNLRVGRTPLDSIHLEVGRRIDLAHGYTIEVTEVELPEATLALSGLGCTPVELASEIATIHKNPWRLEPGYDATGLAHVSATGDEWIAHVLGTSHVLRPGTRLNVMGRAIEVIEVPLAGVTGTIGQLDEQRPFRLVARYESVHFIRNGRHTVVLSGMSAKIITELVRYASPVPWEWVAREIFGSIPRHSARMRWDRNLKTLRRKLREGGIRGDLAFCDGHGNVELVIGPRDTIVDES